MSRGRNIADDFELVKWDEIRALNNYALFMGYLSMAIRGLGFLVGGWTTVVLLGGFVSMLQKEDFWCLTFITFQQTFGIFDIFLSEKLKLTSLVRSTIGWFVIASAVISDLESIRGPAGLCTRFLVIIVGFVPILVLGFVWYPLVTVYSFGLLISAGLSLWRLRQHGDAAANLKPALYVLYSLALLQSVLFCYKYILGLFGSSVIHQVARRYGDQKHSWLTDYFVATVLGCEKDPSFATGRNLITYAVDLMKSESPGDYLSGTRTLDTLIQRQEKFIEDPSRRRELIEQHMLMKHMIIVSASSSHMVLRKLLQTLDSRSPYDRETRLRAARIVAHLAGDIRLDKFPWGIQCISSLIDTFEEYRLLEPYQRDWLLETYEQDWHQHARHLPSSGTEASQSAGSIQKMEEIYNKVFKAEIEKGWYPFPRHLSSSQVESSKAYKELLLQGLRILRKLAADGYNCSVMSNAKGLLSKIMAPVTSDLLHHIDHHIDHGTWSDIVQRSLEVMSRLASAPGETGAKLRGEISSSKEAITTVERIIKCDGCGTELQKRAMEFRTQLCMDTQGRENFIKMLVDIFTDDNKYKSIRKLAGEALAMLSFQAQSNATIILQANGDVVGNLTKILLYDENKTYRISAAEILEHLCSHDNKDEECLKKLKKAMTDAIPKVLGEILCCESTREETHTGTEADQVGFSGPGAGTDIENPCNDGRGKSSSSSHPQNDEQDEDEESSSSSHPQNNEQDEDEEFQAALLSLCVTICDTFISVDQDLARQLDAINEFSFPRTLKEMVVKNSVTTAGCLRLMKLTCKMVISMMKHGGSYIEPDLKSLMESLSCASERMLLLDGSMVFASGDHGATTTKPSRALASLVKEAQELVDKNKAQEFGHIET